MNYFIQSTIWFAVFEFGVYGCCGMWWHWPQEALYNFYVLAFSVYWLIGITVIPWNIYFKAVEVKDANESIGLDALDGITTQHYGHDRRTARPEDIEFVRRAESISLTLAIFMHMVTGLGMYLLSYYHVWSFGTYAAVLSVLLSFLRPLERYYRYCKDRLNDIKRRMRMN